MNAAALVDRRLLSGWQQQFRGLNERHPGLWPPVPRLLLLLLFMLSVVLAGGWQFWLGQCETLDDQRAEEGRLRKAYQEKSLQSRNLEALREQRARVMSEVAKLDRQLPGKAEMDAMLSEINQAGLGRGLQFELFKPGQVQLREYYAELPIDIRLSGKYHSIAGFVSDIANLPRIVTIDHMIISRQKDVQTFQAVAHTYRYLDKAEIDARKKRQSDLAKSRAKP